MSLFLLDTNIISPMVRSPDGDLARFVRSYPQEEVCTSIIVAAELRYGAFRRGSERLSAQLERVLQTIAVLPLDRPADRIFGQLRTELEPLGLTIGPNDYLIAAHALAIDAVLVTDNEREFRRVNGVRVENWLRR